MNWLNWVYCHQQYHDMSKLLSFKELIGNLSSSFSDDKGWIRHNKLTPLQNVRDYFNPTSNQGNNFWSSKTAQSFSNPQKYSLPSSWKNILQPINRENQIPFARTVGRAGEIGAFGPVPSLISMMTKLKPETALPISHYFAGTDITGLAERAVTGGRMLPQREKYETARTLGGTTAGLIMGGPISVLKSAGMGGLLGAGIQAGKNIVNKEPVFEDVGKEAWKGAKYGAKTSPTFAFTNAAVEHFAKTIPFLNKLTEKSIRGIAPTAQMTFGQALKSLGKDGFRRIIKAALIETPIEGLTYGVKEREKGQKLFDSIVNQTYQNGIYNIGFAGLNTAWDSRTLAPIIKKSFEQALDAHPELQAKNLNLGLNVKPLTEEEHKANITQQPVKKSCLFSI